MTEYIAGQEIDAPVDPRVLADIGPAPWDGTPGTLENGAPREIVSVSPRLRDYIVQQKTLAGSLLESDPVLGPLKDTWVQFQATTKPIRDRCAAELAQIDAERRYADNPHVKKMLDGRAQVARARALAERNTALQSQIDAKLEALKELEQTVRAEQADPQSWRPSAADMAAVVELRQSLQLMGPTYGVPILQRQLVTEPAVRNQGHGKASALLPILRSMYESNFPTGFTASGDPKPRGYRTYEVADVIQQAEAVRRDSAYYANDFKLQAIQLARYKLGVLRSEWVPPEWARQIGGLE
jgi:hypothetical protein